MDKTENAPVLTGAQKTRLSLLIFASRIALFWERALPYLLLPAALAALFFIMSWTGFFAFLPDMLARLLLLALFFAGLASLVPLARQPYPEKKEAIARLDRQAPHRIVSTLSDRLAPLPSAQARELWQMHQRRLAEKLQAIRLYRPHPDMGRDKYGLRFAAVLALCVAAAMAGPERLSKVRQALMGGLHDAHPPRLDAWITPPAYTGRAPVFLDLSKKQAVSLSVPQGSMFALRTAAGQGVELKIDNGQAPAASDAGDKALVKFESRLDANAKFTIQHYGRTLSEGEVRIEPDLPPHISLMEPVQVMLGKSLRLRAKVKDDYGIAQAEARLTLSEEKTRADFRLNRNKPAQPLLPPPQFPLNLGVSRPRDAVANTIKDLSEHPYAGLAVSISLAARDDAGNEATAEAGRIVLPARPFSKPLAQALIALRQTLALDKRARGAVGGALDLILTEPEKRISGLNEYLQLAALRAQLLNAYDDDGLRAVLARMWDVAVYIENGDLSEAERALAEAQSALERAIDNNASDEEISKLMQNLRQAMADYLKQLQNQASQNAPDGKIPPNMKFLTQNDIEQMMRRIEQLSRSGAKDAARQQLQQLRDILSALRNSDPSNSGEAMQMQKQLNDIANLMREQQKLMDKTFQERNRARNAPNGQDKARPAPGGPGSSQQNGSSALRELEQKQGELRGKLQDLQKKLPEGSEQSGQAMKDADGSMGAAEGQLQQNAPAGALPEQGKALESMRKGAQALMREQGAGEGTGKGYGFNEGEGNGSLDAPARYNPFSMGDDMSEGDRVPKDIDRKTIQDILDEVKRRLSDPARPKPERDYLERLLRPF